MKKCEKQIYSRLIQIAIEKIGQAFPLIPQDGLSARSKFNDFAIVKLPETKLKFMVKLCPAFWERDRIELTAPEVCLLKDCQGVVFMMGQSRPTIPVQKYDYQFVYCSTDMIREEVESHLKKCESVCCMQFKYVFYNSRILTYGDVI